MKRQSTKLILIALTIMLTIVGCSPNVTQSPAPLAPTATPVTYPTGVFTKANWTMEIFDDGTAHVFQQFVDSFGTYTVTGNQVVVKDDFCKDITGTYNWSYDGQVLSFTAVQDKCMDRKNVMHQSKWKKTP